MSQRSATDIWQSPEERELARKLSELASLEAELAERELELISLQAELRTFEVWYLRIVGACYAELNELEAQIAEAEVHLNPKEHKVQENATQTRSRAQESVQAVDDAQEPKQWPKFEPSERLKKLYRDVAKCIHPDLATDEQERLPRHRLRAEANDAYKEGDEARLQAILREWDSAPEAVKGEEVGAELIVSFAKLRRWKSGSASSQPRLQQ